MTQRNFDPETRTLRKRTQVDAELEDSLEKNVEGLAERIIVEDEERRAQDLVRCLFVLSSRLYELIRPSVCIQDLFNIVPKRPNWDLKRELEKKVAKLERQNQQAIHTLIRMSY